MDDKDNGLLIGCLCGLFLAFGIVFIFAFSWLVTCVLVYWITLCLGYEFSWILATSIWIALILLRSIITNAKKMGE